MTFPGVSPHRKVPWPTSDDPGSTAMIMMQTRSVPFLANTNW